MLQRYLFITGNKSAKPYQVPLGYVTKSFQQSFKRELDQFQEQHISVPQELVIQMNGITVL